MSRKETMPYEVRQEVLWIVRGYDRRVKAHHEAVRQIIEGSGSSDNTGMPSGSRCSRTVEDKAEKLSAIEAWPETRKMRAVEQAKLHIGADMENEELRQRLVNGIILNCESRHEYPFRYMDLPGVSKSDFYRQKDNFLLEIAENLHMI